MGMQLYTDEFYQRVVSKKLAPGGIFVTQSGPAGVISCTEVSYHGQTETQAHYTGALRQCHTCAAAWW